MKKGRIVPVKVTIVDDCTGAAVTGSTGESVTVKVITAAFQATMSNDAVETFSDAGSSGSGTTAFRWSDLGYWIYNLDSSGLSVNTNYEVHAVVNGIQVNTTYAILRPTK